MPEHTSYRDRRGDDIDKGAAIHVGPLGERVWLELGVMRNFGSMSSGRWAALSLQEARELADDLRCAASEAEKHRNSADD